MDVEPQPAETTIYISDVEPAVSTWSQPPQHSEIIVTLTETSKASSPSTRALLKTTSQSPSNSTSESQVSTGSTPSIRPSASQSSSVSSQRTQDSMSHSGFTSSTVPRVSTGSTQNTHSFSPSLNQDTTSQPSGNPTVSSSELPIQSITQLSSSRTENPHGITRPPTGIPPSESSAWSTMTSYETSANPPRKWSILTSVQKWQLHSRSHPDYTTRGSTAAHPREMSASASKVCVLQSSV